MEVAIIDDGIDSMYFPIIGNLIFDLKFGLDGSITQRNISQGRIEGKPGLSHGTIVAAIIRKHALTVKLGSLKILEKNGKSSVAQLISALLWCYNNNIKLIHMSLGSKRLVDYYKLYSIINKLYKKGCILVAATSNLSQFSVPACFSCVISVNTDSNIDLTNELYSAGKIELDGVDFIASSKHFLYDYTNNMYFPPICNSFAAPYITAKMCNLLEKNSKINLAEAKTILCPNHKFVSSRLDFIDSAIGLFFKNDYNQCFGDSVLSWSPVSYKELVHNTQFTEKCSDAPILLIIGSSEVIIRFAVQLNLLFIKADYDSKIFTTIDFSNHFVDWIPYNNAGFIRKFLSRQIDFFCLDVAILCTESIDPLYHDYQAKIIFVDDIKYKTSKENLYFIANDFKEYDVVRTFDRLLYELSN